MSTAIPDQYLPLLEVGHAVVYPVVTILVMGIIYGFYLALFALCIHLLHKGEARYRTLYTTCITVLFMVATCMVVAETAEILQGAAAIFMSAKLRDFLPLQNFLTHDTLNVIMWAFVMILPIIANAVADVILIQRCYVVWGSKKLILVPLIFVSVVVNVTSSTGAIQIVIGVRDKTIASNLELFNNGENTEAIGLILSAGFNSLLTLLTAGRIWWLARWAKSSRIFHVVTTMNKIILESGILYPVTIALHLSITNTFPTPFDTISLTVLAAGIAPTLIIVRIRLGVNALGDKTTTPPPQSSMVFLDPIQPTRKSMCRSQISVVDRRISRVEDVQVQPPPTAHQIEHSV